MLMGFGDPFCHRWSGIESGECLLPVNINSVAIGGEADMPRPRRRINPARMTQHRRLRTFAAQKCVHDERSWFSSTHIVTQKESPANEPYRYKLRLRCGGFPAGVTVALFCLWQDCNNEGVDYRCGLRRWHD